MCKMLIDRREFTSHFKRKLIHGNVNQNENN
uniref:Uncharacterized protein n=1 Tax=Anguilla anguilla TaxID=7936 RepID=A0A0E9QDV3_ANGAN